MSILIQEISHSCILCVKYITPPKIHRLDLSFTRLYRLNSQRKFGNLFSAHNNGCPYLQAGIGNISFVKDLMTQSDLPNNFTCSKFGPNTHPNLGWVDTQTHCLCQLSLQHVDCVVQFLCDTQIEWLFSVLGKNELLPSK